MHAQFATLLTLVIKGDSIGLIDANGTGLASTRGRHRRCVDFLPGRSGVFGRVRTGRPAGSFSAGQNLSGIDASRPWRWCRRGATRFDDPANDDKVSIGASPACAVPLRVRAGIALSKRSPKVAMMWSIHKRDERGRLRYRQISSCHPPGGIISLEGFGRAEETDARNRDPIDIGHQPTIADFALERGFLGRVGPGGEATEAHRPGPHDEAQAQAYTQ